MRLNRAVKITIRVFNLPFKIPIPSVNDRVGKLLTVSAAVVMCVSLLSFMSFSVVVNNKAFQQKHDPSLASPLPNVSTAGSIPNKASQNGDNTAVGIGGSTSATSPVVALKATPGSVSVGQSSKLEWSVTNNPTSCVASEDWSGKKSPTGTESTPVLAKAQSYMYTLTCKNSEGTGYASVSVGAIEQGGSGAVATRPAVTVAANPASVIVNDSTTLYWNVTNNPDSCTASGDWSGTKSASGQFSTSALASVRTYTYKLTCTNSAGSGFATASVVVTKPPPGIPTVKLATNPPSPLPTGSSTTLSWNVTNSPESCEASGDWSGSKPVAGSQKVGPMQTAKTYTYKLTCTNISGTAFDTAVILTLPGAPSVALSVSPTSIRTGQSVTINWSTTNDPTSCEASGDWSGTRPASGSENTGPITRAGIYTYSLSCSNFGGTGYSSNVTVKVL